MNGETCPQVRQDAHLLMKTARVPLIALVLLFVWFPIQLKMDERKLPNMVATHFDGAGHPNQYMTRSTHLKTLAFFGFVVPLAELGLFYCMRFFRADRINIPNRHYWLDPERREQTLTVIMRQGIWLACITLGFFSLIEWVLVAANATKPPQLDMALILAPTIGFLICVLGWVVALLIRFNKAPKQAP